MNQTADNGFSQSSKRAFRNPWVLGWLGAIILVLGVNVTMITIAVLTNPGLVVEDYYEQGRDWEKTINSQLAARNSLGWQVSLQTPKPARAGQPGLYRFVATDQVGVPLTGAQVTLHLYRPSDASADFDVQLNEVRPGQYEASIAFPLKGIWDLNVKVIRGDDSYDVKRRLSIAA